MMELFLCRLAMAHRPAAAMTAWRKNSKRYKAWRDGEVPHNNSVHI